MRAVQEALSGIGIPVMAGTWKPLPGQNETPDQYVIYSVTSSPAVAADDELLWMRTYIYMDLWSTGDPTDMAMLIRSRMLGAGFLMVEESDTASRDSAYDMTSNRYTVQWTWYLSTRVSYSETERSQLILEDGTKRVEVDYGDRIEGVRRASG